MEAAQHLLLATPAGLRRVDPDAEVRPARPAFHAPAEALGRERRRNSVVRPGRIRARIVQVERVRADEHEPCRHHLVVDAHLGYPEPALGRQRGGDRLERVALRALRVVVAVARLDVGSGASGMEPEDVLHGVVNPVRVLDHLERPGVAVALQAVVAVADALPEVPAGGASVRLPALRELKHVARQVRGPAPAFGARQRLQPLRERRLLDEAIEDEQVDVGLAPAPGLGQPIRDGGLPAGRDERAAEVRGVRAEPVEAQRAEHERSHAPASLDEREDRPHLLADVAQDDDVQTDAGLRKALSACARLPPLPDERPRRERVPARAVGHSSCSASQSARSGKRPSSVVTTSRSRLRSVSPTVAAGRSVPGRRSSRLADRSKVMLEEPPER